jgi:NAD(P)-dependent dehydrogenase (short-subunit alcohol dehydrogenase family)
MANAIDLSNCIGVVAGGARGIGYAYAARLLRSDAVVTR